MKIQILKTDITHIKDELKDIIKVDDIVMWYMAKKSDIVPILIKDVPTHVSLILKQEMLSIGSDAAISSNSIMKRKAKENILLLGAPHIYRKLAIKLKQQSFGLKELSEKILTSVKNYEKFYEVKTKIMGILNLTPDSFYDGGQYMTKEPLKQRISELEKYSSVIDIGGESSRPGSDTISVEEEIKRLKPFFKSYNGKLPISLDTYKYEVFKKFQKKVKFLNDITALSDERMLPLLKDTKHKIIIMHMKGSPKTMQRAPYYKDVINELLEFFEKKINYIIKNGINAKRIIIDPGIGFGKRYKDNLRILREIEALKMFGVNILIGHSNKSLFKDIYKNEYGALRGFGTLGISTYLIEKKINYIRVHDVKAHRALLKTLQAIRG
ncbi:dihydropteroate synthase [bacterium]|nr:dihydropteroate synthase [bacterium]